MSEQQDDEQVELHTATVLLASGDVDEWEGVRDAIMDMDMGGALLVVGADERVVCTYAPGMWMKVEYDAAD